MGFHWIHRHHCTPYWFFSPSTYRSAKRSALGRRGNAFLVRFYFAASHILSRYGRHIEYRPGHERGLPDVYLIADAWRPTTLGNTSGDPVPRPRSGGAQWFGRCTLFYVAVARSCCERTPGNFPPFCLHWPAGLVAVTCFRSLSDEFLMVPGFLMLCNKNTFLLSLQTDWCPDAFGPTWQRYLEISVKTWSASRICQDHSTKMKKNQWM
jgi:hypothetical protein